MLLSGSWIPVAQTMPGDIGTMFLLTNGTVMAQIGGTNRWYARN